MKQNIAWSRIAPSPRLPSGRLRPSSTGYGEGRGEGAHHKVGFAEAPLTEPDIGPARGPVARSTSPRKRGEVK